MLDVILQFVLELIRALLIDVLSSHVRRGLAAWLNAPPQSRHNAILRVHRRNRERLLNRLRTGDKESL